MCSFWYVECLSRLGDLEQARFYFEKMLGYANHLASTVRNWATGVSTWEFPAGLHHLALISAATTSIGDCRARVTSEVYRLTAPGGTGGPPRGTVASAR